METNKYTLHKIDGTEAIPFGLLLLADETKPAIEKYIYKSAVYTLYVQDNLEPIAVFALYRVNSIIIEIKNVAVLESMRSMGIGSLMLNNIKEIARKEGFKEIIVGTPSTGTKEIQFYERNGFTIYSLKRDFYINNYPEPIIENGVRLKDMVMLKWDVISCK